MKNQVFKKTIFISLLGHITVFSIFGFSFGNRIPNAEYARVYFWGQLLRNSQVNQPISREPALLSEQHFPAIAGSRLIFSAMRDPVTNLITERENDWLKKPPFTLAFNSGKEVFIEKPTNKVFSPRRKEQTIIFHPLLPYGFTLYFKDRQVAHVELMFKPVSAGIRNSILVKRKISSGNLEVDLLVLRYIGHYLFIQQPRILVNNWQIVKIDLSAKND